MAAPAPERQARAVLASGLVLLVAMLLAGWIGERGREARAARHLALFSGEPSVRVRLTAFGRRDVNVEARGLEVARGDGDWTESGRSLRVGARDGLPVLDGEVAETPCRLRSRDGVLELDGMRYPGVLNLRSDPNRGLVFILEVPLETYLSCVLPREMPLASDEAALEAQSIAARSYVVATMLRRREAAWDVVDTEASQVFGALDGLAETARRTVDRTTGVVLAEGEEVLPAYFSATCGGHTRSNGVAFGERARPALAGTRCGFCDGASDHHWQRRIEPGALRRLAGGEAVRSVIVVGDGSRGADGRLRLTTASGRSLEIGARELRGALGSKRLRSTWFTGAEIRDGALIVSGRGFGHGVGLCQNGARAMALAGRDAREILEHYYPGAELVTVGE
ncbi:MAG: SpoIID/LytB domain-containing protein [Planctomycetota bacterium]